MATSGAPVHAFARPTRITSDQSEDEVDVRRPYRRIHPLTYLISLVSAGILCILAVNQASSYLQPPEHSELLRIANSGNLTSDAARPESYITAATNWNSLANALGGFSTSFVHSPQLNVSWIGRPAGFGPRIAGRAGLEGRLDSISKFSTHSATVPDSDSARKGCQVDLEKMVTNIVPRIALIERGGCPFIVKLINAQALQFQAAIIYNDPLHASHAGGPFSSEYAEEDELISMWSPSREASKLTIPSVFVAYNTGRTLENLQNIAKAHEEEFRIVLEAEEPPHLYVIL